MHFHLATKLFEMFSDIVLFSLCLLITGILIFVLIYFFITLSDLECDYINAVECCAKLNFWNVPKLWLQLAIQLMLLLFGRWALFLLNLPLCAWLVRAFWLLPKRRRVGVEYDSSEIYENARIREHMWGIGGHFAYQMMGMFVYLYCLLDAVMNEPVVMEQDDVEMLNRPAAAKEIYTPKHYDTGSDL